MNPRKLVLFYDYCYGQNKNNLVLQFLHWLVYYLELVEDIELHYFIVGRSKHSDDRYFGLISSEKKRREQVESIFDVENLIRNASVCNKVVMIRDKKS